MSRKIWRNKINTADSDLATVLSSRTKIANTIQKFKELSQLSPETKEQLMDAIISADGFARAGLSVKKRGVSNVKLANDIFMCDVADALRRVGIEPRRWDKQYDNGAGESFYFRFTRALAEDLQLRKLPIDLKDTARRGGQIRRILKEG